MKTVLSVRRCQELPAWSYFVANWKDNISIRDIFNSLHAVKVFALPSFHAFLRSDTMSSISGIVKLYWRSFSTAPEGMLLAFTSIGMKPSIYNEATEDLEKICQVYLSKILKYYKNYCGTYL